MNVIERSHEGGDDDGGEHGAADDKRPPDAVARPAVHPKMRRTREVGEQREDSHGVVWRKQERQRPDRQERGGEIEIAVEAVTDPCHENPERVIREEEREIEAGDRLRSLPEPAARSPTRPHLLDAGDDLHQSGGQQQRLEGRGAIDEPRPIHEGKVCRDTPQRHDVVDEMRGQEEGQQGGRCPVGDPDPTSGMHLRRPRVVARLDVVAARSVTWSRVSSTDRALRWLGEPAFRWDQ